MLYEVITRFLCPRAAAGIDTTVYCLTDLLDLVEEFLSFVYCFDTENKDAGFRKTFIKQI